MEKKQIKVLIKSITQSENYIYGLYVSSNCAENILLSVSFNSLCERFALTGWNGWASSLPENELTVAFCILANRAIPDYSFVVATKEEMGNKIKSADTYYMNFSNGITLFEKSIMPQIADITHDPF